MQSVEFWKCRVPCACQISLWASHPAVPRSWVQSDALSLHRVPLWPCGSVSDFFQNLAETLFPRVAMAPHGSIQRVLHLPSGCLVALTVGASVSTHTTTCVRSLISYHPPLSWSVRSVGPGAILHCLAVPKLMKICWIETDGDVSRESRVNRQKQLKPHPYKRIWTAMCLISEDPVYPCEPRPYNRIWTAMYWLPKDPVYPCEPHPYKRICTAIYWLPEDPVYPCEPLSLLPPRSLRLTKLVFKVV